MLAARGVADRRAARPTPAARAAANAREIAHVESPPLAQIVEQMLTVSNDETAELLTREIGVVAHAGAAPTAAGTHEIPVVLAGLGGTRRRSWSLHDGSGLAPDDRITCAALSGVVALGDAAEVRGASIDGLAIAGQHRNAGRPARRNRSLYGRLRAKTGHIDGVVGLAGVIDRRRGPAFRRLRVHRQRRLLDDGGRKPAGQIAEAIGSYLDTRRSREPHLVPRAALECKP